jgi:hypothetical protein
VEVFSERPTARDTARRTALVGEDDTAVSGEVVLPLVNNLLIVVVDIRHADSRVDGLSAPVILRKVQSDPL